jgi:hypothetical protein
MARDGRGVTRQAIQYDVNRRFAVTLKMVNLA